MKTQLFPERLKLVFVTLFLSDIHDLEHRCAVLLGGEERAAAINVGWFAGSTAARVKITIIGVFNRLSYCVFL
jgi:hypothetical protein